MSGCRPVNSSALTLYKKMNEGVSNPPIQKQVSLVSLLGSDINPPIFSTPSIKRTLSADMSCPKWHHNNGFKRAQSSDRLHALGEQDFNKQQFVYDSDPVNEDEKKGAFEDIWSSILSQKKTDGLGSGQLPPPYVHPLERRSASSLSETSLEICTESLGSETGSDVFSFPISSGPEDSEDAELAEDQPDEQGQENPNPICRTNDEMNEMGHVGLTKYCPANIRGPPSPSPSPGPRSRSSFPPPLPSLVHRNGSNLHMRSHRQDGRLVLEAVSVPSQSCFRAQRHGGRLLLTLAGDDDSCKNHLPQEEDVLNVEDYVDEIDDEVDEEEKQMVYDKEEEEGSRLSIEMINVHRPTSSALIMSKFICTRNNSTWRRNINATIIKDLDDQAEEDKASTPKSLLPPRPKMARIISANGPKSTTTTSALNPYEYYWRQTGAVAVLKPLAGQQKLGAVPQVEKESNYMSKLLLEHNNEKSNSWGQAQQEVVVVKAVGTRLMTGDQREKEVGYLVPFFRGCKEPRRSFLLLEPHCIATT